MDDIKRVPSFADASHDIQILRRKPCDTEHGLDRLQRVTLVIFSSGKSLLADASDDFTVDTHRSGRTLRPVNGKNFHKIDLTTRSVPSPSTVFFAARLKRKRL